MTSIYNAYLFITAIYLFICICYKTHFYISIIYLFFYLLQNLFTCYSNISIYFYLIQYLLFIAIIYLFIHLFIATIFCDKSSQCHKNSHNYVIISRVTIWIFFVKLKVSKNLKVTMLTVCCLPIGRYWHCQSANSGHGKRRNIKARSNQACLDGRFTWSYSQGNWL